MTGTMIDDLRRAMSPTLDGASRLKDLLHETTETDGEMRVLQKEGMTVTVTGAAVAQMTAKLSGVEGRQTDSREVDPLGEEGVAVEMTGDGTIVHRAGTTLTDVNVIWTGRRVTTIAETATSTVAHRHETTTECRETVNMTAVIVTQTEDHPATTIAVTATLIDHRVLTETMTEGRRETASLTVGRETGTWIVAGSGTETLTARVLRELSLIHI